MGQFYYKTSVDDTLKISSVEQRIGGNELLIKYNDTTHNRFNAHHHKHSDNMDIISKKTLHAVGQTVLEVLYNE